MVDDGALEDEINAPEHPLFLLDDGYESDSDDPVADQDYADDLVDASAADQEDINNLINGDNDDDDDDLDEEVVPSMMTGGCFTREQVLEVKGLANDLMAGLRHRAKAWECPLDAVMLIANLVIATKEWRAGGNAWNAYQNALPEDPEKATSFPGPRHEYVAEAKELVAEHTKCKVVTAQKISFNAAELGSQMKSLNKRWSDDVKWGAKLNMHIMYIIISGNPDVAASKHNTMHWTNLWNRLFTADDHKCLTVKWLEPPEDQALQLTTMLVHNSDDLTLCVADWEGEVAKKKPSAKDGSVPSEQGGTSGDPNPDDGADGTTRPNPKRRRKNEVTDGSGTRRGEKRKKVVSNLIIEDEDEGLRPRPLTQ
ncbi:hypothetical protein BS47DRAFT_1416522 [Hydnum rufescens UP504]|uniref:Uncharacterized protein n=1 Tax=Hydnum rufescens UP504 TaxID=1448309 RepID=A0A9P6DXQ2_9AGAM|nr:hypothetical protein BS47DRAFT_1416522 [Hydnum rufescens UP504]